VSATPVPAPRSRAETSAETSADPDLDVAPQLPLSRWDAFQRRHPVISLPLAVVYKFFDDQGVYLAVIITYYVFVSVVPLLLLATSILGFLLQGDPELRSRVLDSAVASFPVVGDQLGTPQGLTGSTAAIVIGGLTALYGSLGLGNALQNAINVAWSVPRNSRPNPFLTRFLSLLLLLLGGVSIIAVSAVSTVAQVASDEFVAVFADLSTPVRVLLPLVTVACIAGIVAVLLWLGSSRRQSLRAALPGAIFIAFCWQGIQLGSTELISHSLAQASSMNKTFGLVLGLLAVFYAVSLTLVLGVQLNVVLHRGLWPRALLTPFTDSVDLTDADRRAYAGYARAQRHKGFEKVHVEFDPPPALRDEADQADDAGGQGATGTSDTPSTPGTPGTTA
jgi:uncharacterized BrkB/YihY/UPF0761 family membrane protein